MARNIDADVAEDLDGVLACALALHRANAHGNRRERGVVLGQMPPQSLRHRAAADVAGADEKELFHGRQRRVPDNRRRWLRL